MISNRRGPKLRTAKNTPGNAPGFIRHKSLTPTSPLTPEAQSEFERLLAVLDSRRTLDRVDLAVVTNAARIKALLDRLYAGIGDNLDPAQLKGVTTLLAQHRGLLRELGLTLQPSRSVVHTQARVASGNDPIERFLKLGDPGGSIVRYPDDR